MALVVAPDLFRTAGYLALAIIAPQVLGSVACILFAAASALSAAAVVKKLANGVQR